MKNIYIVRHCQAEGQAPDAPLTAAGAQQAGRLAQFLSGKNIDYIISSPFSRAYRTITPLADKLGVEIVLEERLSERVLSAQNHPEWRNMLLQTYEDLDLCYEGGESSNTAMGRAISVVKEVLDSKNSNIVVVSHGNLISLLLKHFDHRIGFKEWERLSNPDVYQLSFLEDEPSIHRIWVD
ncbi:histidine phosphatase family protein [Paenibacillus sp. 1011MAR3C5]|uniref:histidine phosphatase family protein n=1 Tax=Paenibacillus sp. 1011MAR3C5 TaxID=1675787 RepID=UPI000E6C079C|nr:histidine phosphatase family protein [Paenibacillus sp. 1011MAR3C5]RJE87429.1 histidine phosphatase family protein [Paenibacillus sp. 1011MAR3C5]